MGDAIYTDPVLGDYYIKRVKNKNGDDVRSAKTFLRSVRIYFNQFDTITVNETCAEIPSSFKELKEQGAVWLFAEWDALRRPKRGLILSNTVKDTIAWPYKFFRSCYWAH